MKRFALPILLAFSLAVQAPARPQHHRDPTVYVTDTGHKYHRANCRYLSHSKHAMKLSEAKKEGYEPCKVCRPPR